MERISQFLQDVPSVLRDSLEKNERVIIEGTQGFGLSPFHARHFPYVTSRDTTASAFLAETGLSPLDVDDVVLVIRTFPIRVAGEHSGPLPNEIDWQVITKECGSDKAILERTSVTKKVRRVARFSSDVVKLGIKVNQPSKIVLNHLDYIPKDNYASFLNDIEKQIERKIDLVGSSPRDLSERKQFSHLRVV